MKQNRLLSIVLCLCLLASLVSVSFTGAAFAQTVTTANYKTVLKLTFDGSEPYGMALHRGFSSYAYENGYLMMNNAANNGGVGFLAKDGALGQNPFRANWQQATASDASLAAKADLLRLSVGKTYRLSFDFKYLDGTGGTSRTMSVIIADDPSMKYGTNDSSQGLTDRTTVVEQTPASGTVGAAWKSASYTFTVNDTAANANGVSIGLHPGYSASHNTYVAVDNILVEEVIGSTTLEYNRIFHDMETETTSNISKSGGTVSFVDSGDTAYGKVMKFDGTANARASFSDAGIIDKGKKYYVSFDAKADADGTAPQTVIGNPGGNSTYKRYFFTGYQTQGTGVSFYIDGQSVSAANFKISTQWQRFGLVIDTSNEALLSSINSYQSSFWSASVVYFLFGGVNCYFDNYELVEITNVPQAVPSLEKFTAEVSIRTPKAATADTAYISAGLRFKGTVPASLKEASDEIGFVLTPSTVAVGNSTWYDISSGVKSGVKTVACYNKSTGLDVVYKESASSAEYQLILTGLSSEDGKTAYIRRYSTVMYLKSGSSYTYYALGETSYNEVMALYNATDADYTMEQTPEEPIVPDDSWKSHPEDYKLVALTFDDAPISGSSTDSNVNMVKIVNTLNKYCGAGTFFVIGSRYDTYGSNLLQYAVDNGFELGNHTQTHPSWAGCEAYANETAQYYIDNELKPVNDKIAAGITDNDGNPYKIKFVRASNMYSCESIIDACKQLNMPLVTGNQNKSGTFVTISEDKPEFIDAAVNNAYDGKILLMHCGDQTATELDTICEKLYRQGYRFCTLSELFEYKLGVTDMSTVDLEASIGGNSSQKGIFDVTQVKLNSYREDQWYLHPEDYKLIAFTFDDGPVYSEKGDNAVTKVIDAFEQYHGAATFFFTGRSLNSYGKGIPEYALSKGHELANHSYNHGNLGTVTDKATAIKEVSDVNDWYTSNMKYTVKWFRGGGYSESDYTWEYLSKIGMPSVASVMGFSDYSGGSSTVDGIKNWFNTNTLENGSIIGMHSTNTSNVTPDALAEVLPALYQQGYRFCTLSQLCKLQGIDYEDIPTDKYISRIAMVNGVAAFN